MKRFALCVLMALAFPSVSMGQVIFQANFNSANSPTFGFDGVSGAAELGAVVSRTHLGNTAGPNGEPAIRFTWTHDASQMNSGAQYGGEFYLGWGVDMGSAPGSGENRYVLWRMRVSGDCESVDSTDGTVNSPMQHKLFILGDGAADRMIGTILCDPLGDLEVRMAIDGAHYGSVIISRDTWVSVQMGALTGPSGWIRMWVNNDVEGSPDHTWTATLGYTTWDQFGFGYYANRQIDSDGSLSIDYTAPIVRSTFDTTWHSGQSGGGSAGPVRIRIVGAALGWLLVAGVVPWHWRKRKRNA